MTIRVTNRDYGWSDVTTWTPWTAWSGAGLNINNNMGLDNLTFTTDYHDFGRIVAFSLSTNLRSNGTNTIQIQVANTLPDVESSWTNKDVDDPLTARYVRFGVTVAPLNNVAPVSESFEAFFQVTHNDESFTDLNLSTLPGTTASRTLPIHYRYNQVINLLALAPYTHQIEYTDKGSAPKVKGVLRSNGNNSDTTATITIYGLPAMERLANGNISLNP